MLVRGCTSYKSIRSACVCSSRRQVLPYSSRPLDRYVRAAIPHSIQHSLQKSSEWPLSYYSPLNNKWDKITMPQVMTKPDSLSSVDNTYDSSLLTDMLLRYFLRPFSTATSYSSPALFKVHESAPYRRVLQMTVFIILSFRQRHQAFVSSPFLLVNAFFARAILDLISFSQDSSHIIRPPRQFKCDS